MSKNRVERAFIARPPQLRGGIELRVEEGEGRWPGVYVSFRVDDGRFIEFRARGLLSPYPSQLNRLVESEPGLELVLMERVPAGIRRELEQLRIPYLDLNGGGEILEKGLIYVVPPVASDVPAPWTNSSNALNPFTWRASRVPRALLHAPERVWGITELAMESDLTPGHTHRIISGLEAAGVVERDEKRVVLADASTLLDIWASNFRRGRDEQVVRVRWDLSEQLHRLSSEIGNDWVASGAFALTVYAPYWESRSAVLYCFDDIQREELHRGLASDRFDSMEEPWVVTLVEADRAASMYSHRIGGLQVADPIQVYLDLLAEGGRGVEAAENLRRDVIPF
jgi:hypothetical protein